MKKLFYLLFITIAFASCKKDNEIFTLNEPDLIVGKTKKEIKESEKQILISESDTELVFKYNNDYLMKDITYEFKRDSIRSYKITFNKLSEEKIKNILNYLSVKYRYAGGTESPDIDFFKSGGAVFSERNPKGSFTILIAFNNVNGVYSLFLVSLKKDSDGHIYFY